MTVGVYPTIGWCCFVVAEKSTIVIQGVKNEEARIELVRMLGACGGITSVSTTENVKGCDFDMFVTFENDRSASAAIAANTYVCSTFLLFFLLCVWESFSFILSFFGNVC